MRVIVGLQRWVAAAALGTLLTTACGGDDASDTDATRDTTSTAIAGPEGDASPEDGEWFRSVVFDGGEDSIDTFRIPGAIVSEAGTVLVFAEARSLSPHDLDPRRVVVRRSQDHGATWGSIIAVVAPELDPECDHTDPTPVAPTLGESAGDVIVVFRSCGILRASRSVDDGETWSPPDSLSIEPSPDVPSEALARLRAGPGHGIELMVGDDAGRLVLSTDLPLDGATLTQLLLSDDGGHSWRVGAHHRSNDSAGPDPDETALTELADGTILVSARNGSATSPGRIQMRSTDSGLSFAERDGETLEIAPELTVPVVEGALLTEPTTGLAVFSSPSDPTFRRGARLWTSGDGETWAAGPLISQLPAAYSDLVALPDLESPAVGVALETGDRGVYERIDFVRVPVEVLSEPGEDLEDDFDVATAVSGRVIIDGTRFEIVRYCLGEQRIELVGGWIEPDLSGGLAAVGFRAHVDDRGDGTPLDLDGTAELQLESGIRFRGSIDDLDGVGHDIDLVMVNMEVCEPA